MLGLEPGDERLRAALRCFEPTADARSTLPAVAAPISDLAQLLRNLEPVLRPGAHVFASVATGSDVSALEPLATFREAEGLSLIAQEGRAREAGLHSPFRAAWITLEVSATDTTGRHGAARKRRRVTVIPPFRAP